MRELLNGDIHLVSYITPEGAQHLVVELTRLVLGHEQGSLLQALCSHLIGFLSTHLRHVGVVDGTLTEDDEERDEDQGEDNECHPIGHGTEEEIVESFLAGFARLDIADVLIELLQACLIREVVDSTCSRAFGHIEGEALATSGLVTARGGVEVCELHWRYLVLALMARHNEEVVDLRALETVGSQLGLIGNLRVVLVEVLGNVDDGLLDELEVAHTADDDTQGYRVIGLRRCLIELCRDIKLPHSAREIGRALWQGINLNLDAWSHNLLLDLNIA